jgi:hypothetical protein
MFQRGKSVPLFPPGTFAAMPADLQRLSKAISEATELWDEAEHDDNATEFDEDDSSEFEEDYYHIASSVRTTVLKFKGILLTRTRPRADGARPLFQPLKRLPRLLHHEEVTSTFTLSTGGPSKAPPVRTCFARRRTRQSSTLTLRCNCRQSCPRARSLP